MARIRQKNLKNYNIDELFSSAISLLDQYYIAFPNYTLHNRQHQKNVLRLIGELLGDQIKILTGLECAIIILSVAYHDIGMVFSKSELKKIEEEESFKFFLEDNYKAKLSYQENKSIIDDDLAEWYCRWMHAKRVWLFLDELNNSKWGTLSLKKTIGDICQSHNENTDELNDDSRFIIDFIGEADLRFCSILLRIGDILDFDNSRTPKSVYEFLDLDSPKNKNEKISKDEWNKHLCSDGFRITHNGDKIELRFIAGPQHPQIEKNIQTFLDVIEDELKKSSTIIYKCSDRWRNFRLPLIIDRTGIRSENYKKGDYRLSLDESQIIKLLAGDNLYDNEFVFMRELLQNAIDTSRMRLYHEQSNENNTFKIRPIEITSWIDVNGYRWVRVDDFGMGINEYVAKNHLLKKGNSYYNSDFFKIQKLHYAKKTKKEFTPISRFGIGLLSCFILGDRIEINSKSVAISQTKSKEEKIRLSIQGLQGQYFMQTDEEKHDPLEMPSEFLNEKEFRKDHGTSIAVRINRSKDDLHFEKYFDWVIRTYVFCSPITVNYLGQKIGVDFETTLHTPLAKKHFYPFDSESKAQIEGIIEKPINSDIGIEVLPIDISERSNNDNLKGQIVFFKLKCDDFESQSGSKNWEFQFIIENDTRKGIRFLKQYFNPETKRQEDKQIEIDINWVFENALNIDYFNSLFLSTDQGQKHYQQNIRIIHNGINVPNYHDRNTYRSQTKLEFEHNLLNYSLHPFFNRSAFGIFGIIYLQDNLMPNLSVARNIIKNLSFSIYSNLFFATKEINASLHHQYHYYNYFANIDEVFSFTEVKNDELVNTKGWDNEKLIPTSDGILSIDEIKEQFKLAKQIRFNPNDNGRFLSSLTRGLIAINFNIQYNTGDPENSFFTIVSSKLGPLTYDSVDKYYPLLFVQFDNSIILCHNRFINEKHQLAKWMLFNQDILVEDFEAYFNNLIAFILESNIQGINKVLDHFRKPNIAENIAPSFENISESDFYKKFIQRPPF